MRKVAILLLGYCRPEFTEARLRELAGFDSRGVDFVCSVDAYEGPSQFSILNHFLKLKEEFTNVFWFQEQKRMGLSKHMSVRISECLENYETVIIIEDDVKTHVNAIENILTLWEKGIPESVITVGLFGFLPNLGVGIPLTQKWRRTPYFSAWGWSIDRARWSLYDLEIVKKRGVNSVFDSSIWKKLNSEQKKRWIHRFSKVEKNPNLTWDFQMQFTSWLYEMNHVLPVQRSCENVGFDDDRAQNTRAPKPNWYRGNLSESYFVPEILLEKSVISRALIAADSYSWIGDRKITDFLSFGKSDAKKA